MFRVANSPIIRSTFWLHIQLLVQWINTAADRCHGWDGMQLGWFIKINKRKSRCIFLVVYNVVLMMHGQTTSTTHNNILQISTQQKHWPNFYRPKHLKPSDKYIYYWALNTVIVACNNKTLCILPHSNVWLTVVTKNSVFFSTKQFIRLIYQVEDKVFNTKQGINL